MKSRVRATKKRLTKRKYTRNNNNSKKQGRKRYTRRAVAMKGGWGIVSSSPDLSAFWKKDATKNSNYEMKGGWCDSVVV